MKTLIIEDEYPAAERLEKMIHKADADIQIIGVLDSIAAAGNWFSVNPLPDLIFSDIQLSDGLSFQIFELFSVKAPIIFTTSYDEYAIKAFKVKSIDYLLKPIKQQDLEDALAKFKEMQNVFSPSDYALRIESLLDNLHTSGKKYKNRFLVKQHDQLIPIAQEEIAYFLTANEMVCLIRKDGRQFLVDYTLEELDKLLDPQHFFRLNRQFIASLSSITRIHTYFNGKLKLELKPEASQEVLVSREKAQLFKDWMES
ncbi:LytTR family DNA-binding domain-containing protein [Xanthocytophaga agilis]|uniref:LytTR family DNA-binding domain-containing protein n=1 Tax=Xanthocytophaga agilis TaxID=3048010 RepID=A0AAE3R7D8_9BACT|nr:LytTR family DNA-binding domain-containing protein [Xanthocytophaga agilis]MDJ1504560.1 LytTR family DNA-binding domain-containing protein [Xanthocytophaga agilis]